MQTRKAQRSDIDQIWNIYTKVKLDHSKLGDNTYEADVQRKGFLTGLETREELLSQIENSWLFLVAEDNGIILGFTVVEQSREYKDDEYKTWFDLKLKDIYYNSSKMLAILSLAVDPAYSGKGVASRLLTDIEKTNNTNFALLVKLDLEKNTNAQEFGFSVIKSVNALGNGMPIVQRLGDLKNKRPSKQEDISNNPVKPTLQTYMLEDVSKSFPKIVTDALLKALESLDKVIIGVNSDSTIISAPCLEFCYKKVTVNKWMETPVDGLYISGDVAGYESGIIPASASGILAARGISQKIGKEWDKN